MKKLWCKLFGHSVETTHTNRYQIPTRERCMCCGLSREMKAIPETNCYQWRYSDGRNSIGVIVSLIDDIRFGDIQ